MIKLLFLSLALFYGFNILVTEFAFDFDLAQVETLYSKNFGFFNIIEYLSLISTLICSLYIFTSTKHKQKSYESRYLNNLVLILFLITVTSFIRVVIEVKNVQILYEVRRFLPFFLSYYCSYVATVNRLEKFKLLLNLNFIFGGIKGIQGIFKFLKGELVPISGGLQAIFPGWKESLVFLSLICLAVSISIFSENQNRRYFIGIVSAPMFFSFIFSYRRTFWVALLIVFCVIALNSLPSILKTARRNIILIMIIFSILIISMPLLTSLSPDILASPNIIGAILNPEDDSSLNYRVWESSNAIANLNKSTILELLFGIGIGKEFEVLLPLPRVSEIPTLLYTHNTYLWLWLKLGALGLLVYFLILIAAIRLSLKLYKKANFPFYKSLSLGFLSIFIVISFIGLTAPFFSEAGCSAWFGYLLSSLSSLSSLHAQLIECNKRDRLSCYVSY